MLPCALCSPSTLSCLQGSPLCSTELDLQLGAAPRAAVGLGAALGVPGFGSAAQEPLGLCWVCASPAPQSCCSNPSLTTPTCSQHLCSAESSISPLLFLFLLGTCTNPAQNKAWHLSQLWVPAWGRAWLTHSFLWHILVTLLPNLQIFPFPDFSPQRPRLWKHQGFSWCSCGMGHSQSWKSGQ